ncbi:MAG: protein TolA [Betaproteobacteria bacterium RIFCSPLOWO2_02_FULL_67_26]|nr:MAG: protein TolA [Betaproteobacteria bacterium RIFCSPLOWO2_02_FULL_67_26]
MTAFVYETPNEKAISGALTLVMHLLFLALLVFSVSWQRRQADTMVAELWSSLPQPAPKAEPPPPPPKVEPEPPKPAPRVEAKPVPRVEPRPQPKAEIDLREKREKERKAKEQALAEKKKREEQEKVEAARRQQAKEAAEAKRLAQEQADALKKLAAQQATAREAEIAKYRALISARIKRFIVEPPNLQGNPEAELDIVVLPGGEVLDVRTRKASGQSAWDNAVERAIRRAQPLPLPSDPALMKEFRELNLKFRPKE